MVTFLSDPYMSKINSFFYYTFIIVGTTVSVFLANNICFTKILEVIILIVNSPCLHWSDF